MPLSGLAGLTQLDVHHLEISGEQMAALREALPNTDIVAFLPYQIESPRPIILRRKSARSGGKRRRIF